MFAYCNNNSVNFIDPDGLCRETGYKPWLSVTLKYIDCGRGDCPTSKNYIGFTASVGTCLSLGIGPLGIIGFQVSVATDAAGRSEVQVGYSASGIFSTGLPSVDDMLDRISDPEKEFKLGASATINMAFTNAPSVSDLHGPAYSVGISGSSIAIDYNCLPNAANPNKAYSGVTISGGACSPGVNVVMSNTVWGKSIDFNLFDFFADVHNSMWGPYWG